MPVFSLEFPRSSIRIDLKILLDTIVKEFDSLGTCGIYISIPGTCLTNDIDTLLYHMNNSRYFRELDFARADFFERTGLYRKVLSKGGEILQGAATIRYRRYIRIFSRYKITTKVSVGTM